ncbi:hypothetical protein F7230_05530 [Corynebacterium sp. 320]|uniref:hypothetical protein n=1 Tax=Corynebacterium TaxID=1716 RepID=UPI00125CC5CE|nr:MULTISPECIES: hypothetical protein [Corynebacterium]KAB1503009.1 hypothetical protein F7230_05530 [Corynebacterium sp. 320]KAB1550781.1 hypothetical protein F7233_09680 [Corynebacterium sp. 321]KAB1551138.1 hypothetical protein F7232_08835 [Corynebacterium sp. 319]KAB3526806.1 hypothetical protein F8354_05530 [Corynebacterium sp. 250]KAB3538300.1 hypothetical protein F8390_08430 [Corynebacterium sp. 366]
MRAVPKTALVGVLSAGMILLGGCSQPTLTEGNWALTNSASEDDNDDGDDGATISKHKGDHRSAKDFKDGGKYVVESADGSVACTIGRGSVDCDVDFADPPIYYEQGVDTIYSNKVKWKGELEMFQPVVSNKSATSGERLKVGESFTFNGIRVEQTDDVTIQVTRGGHWFKVSGGEYYSDSFPQEKDANGRGLTGTVCGTIERGEKGFLDDWGYVYAAKDGTDCVRAMEVFRAYISEARDSSSQWSRWGWICAGDSPLPRPRCSNGDSDVFWVHPRRG